MTTDTAQRRSARTATTAMPLTPALLTAITARIGSLAASSSAPDLGSAVATTDGDTMVVGTAMVTAEATMADADIMAADVTTDDRSMGVAESLAAARSVTHAASPVAELAAAPLAASAVERVVGSTVVAADPMAVADTGKNR
jgi:hypothetical protein